jgi:dihydrofolate reductase
VSGGGLVRYHVGVSLDGFIAPLDGSVKWLEPFGSGADFFRFLKGIGGIVMGRAAFETELGYGEWGYVAIPTTVMSSRPIEEPPANLETGRGDPKAALAKLRSRVREGDIWLFGGGVTAGQFLAAGLIDQLEIRTIPVALSHGRPLFAGSTGPVGFGLIETRADENGVVHSVYRRS